MVFIIMEFKKGDLLISEDKSEEGILKKILSKFKDIKNRAKSEMEETKALVRILTYAVKSYAKNRDFDLDKKDIEFIQGQSGDVIKNLLMVVISIIPIPIPITPFLIIFGKKIGIDIAPKEHEIPEKGKKKDKTDESVISEVSNMKIIITERQLNYLLEATNSPCPEGKKEDTLITLDQLRNGSTISKGYCNSNENSAIVKIQTMMQDKGILDSKSYNGYYGDKTQEAVKTLFEPSVVEGTKIGLKTLEKLEGTTKVEKEKVEVKSDKVSKSDALKLFNPLTKNEKILVCTLLGEAGGESNPAKGMQAVANVLKNRAETNHYKYGSTPVSQALADYQFSMWNGYNNGKEVLQDVFDKFKNHDEMQTAINISKSIDSITDITGGAKFYYANYVSPSWAKNTDTTKWVPTTTIGKHKFGNVVNKK